MKPEAKEKNAYLMMIASLLIVGTIGVFRRYIPLPSALLAFFRGLIGAASLLAFVALRGKKSWGRIESRKLGGLVLNGVFLGVNWLLLFEAFNHTTIAKATLSYYMQPSILLLLSPLVFREKLTVKKLICAGVALAGMVLVSGVLGAEGGRIADGRGILFGLAAACFYTLVVILNKKITGVDAYQKTVIQLFSAAAALLPYLLITGQLRGASIDGRVAVLILIVGVVYTGLVYALYFGSMDGLKAQTISMLSYLDPVVAMAVSALVLRERMGAGALLGAVLILGSALVSEYPRADGKQRSGETTGAIHETDAS